MSLPDSCDIDAAVMQKLGADTTLLELMPNGVYFGEAPPDALRYVLVRLEIATDDNGQNGNWIEDVRYLVKAVEWSSLEPKNIRAAAARIHDLLHLQPLTIPGYGWMVTRRVERVRYPEVDTRDRSLRWDHRGGHYQVMAATGLT